MHSSRYIFTIILKCSTLTLSLGQTWSFAHAEHIAFNTDFLKDKTDEIAINALNYGHTLEPGIYEFSLSINQRYIGKRSIRFVETQEHQVEPCFDQTFIDQNQILFINPEQQQINAQGCYDLTAIANAQIETHIGQSQLALTLPQVNLVQKPRGFVSPKEFNQGIHAIILNYSANTSYYHNRGESNHYNNSLFLNGGFNFGPWRYRNNSSFTQYSGEKSRWQSSSNKLERDLQTKIPTRLEIGDSFSSSDVFDSFNFRGVQFSSDSMQLPNSLQNYAPIIQGTAQSNASVEIRQNGYLVYSTHVAPGHFTIRDLYAANDSGDLEVSVIESDGQIRKFIQPYSSVPNMVRPHQAKFQFTAGQYRSGNDQKYHPYFGQLSYAYGVNNYITPYTGMIIGDDYYAGAAGLAFALGYLGSLSTDLTYAHNKTSQGESKDGISIRFLYAKSLNSLGTNFRLVGYRYSSQDYYSFSDAMQERAQWKDGLYEYSYQSDYLNHPSNAEQRRQYFYSPTYYNKRNQFSASINQELGSFGQLYLTLAKTDFWQKEYNQENWQIGYNKNFNRFSYGMFYQHSKSMLQNDENIFGLNLSINLDRIPALRKYDLSSNNSYQHSDRLGDTFNSTLSGNFLEDKNLNAQIQVSHQEQNRSNQVALSSSYRGTKLNSSLAYTYSDQYQQASASIDGGILIHSGGLILGQQMFGNPILIEAKGAEGIRIENQTGLKIDRTGYAVISSSSAYNRNRVALRVDDLGQNRNIDMPIINDIVPTKNAVIKIKFDVKTGHSVLAKLNYQDRLIATASSIIDPITQKSVGLVGLEGQAYLTGVQSNQTLIAKWGDESFEQCQFTLPQLNDREMGYDEININCHAVEEH
ncbi:fimbria/pilus outer membrane usher protein [Acinetobacter rudis]|uniref:fimbria/pilus outer membrane usher protein n=1 Tax=Acinetobacter rudis TaxID=632955 RepID=UPI00280E7E4C|nr:fimbria/pilus outer membrane usher protein [Acinetobacter rudis]MDQ8953958.1 fimbria/pilus outer membrane usher protein [Acinetobacter rudis]